MNSQYFQLKEGAAQYIFELTLLHFIFKVISLSFQ